MLLTTSINTSGHRSIVSSLRSASPFGSPSLALESSFRSDSSRTGRATPSSQTGILVPIDEDERPPPPDIDRSVDLLVVANGLIKEDIPHDQSFDYNNGVAAQQHILFALPAHVRKEIYGYCFPDETRKINLSPRFATKAVFADDYFATPWEVLEPVSGGLGAFRAIRSDLMAYFWTQHHFHVTLTPFSGPKFSPLSHVWLMEYIGLVQTLTVEADLTRFGCSALKAAPKFGYDLEKVEKLLVDIVNGLLKRQCKSTMAELNIMCRRYAGFRPYDFSDAEAEPVQYCPVEVLYLCDAVCNLRGILQQCRISGFTLPYTKTLLSAIFAVGDAEPEFITPADSAWPPPPSQSFSASFNSSLNPSSMVPTSEFELKFRRTHSFAEDFEEEQSFKYESSVYSTYTTAEDNQTTTMDEVPLPTMSGIGTATTIADHVKQYQDLLPPLEFSQQSTAGGHSPHPNNESPTFKHLRNGEVVKTTTFEISTYLPNSTAPPGLDSTFCSTSTSTTASTPRSPDAMNDLNEKDPAFLRTLHALRGGINTLPPHPPPAAQQFKLPPLHVRRPDSVMDVSNVESTKAAERCNTSMSGKVRSEGGRKRYLTFINRLRGRPDELTGKT